MFLCFVFLCFYVLIFPAHIGMKLYFQNKTTPIHRKLMFPKCSDFVEFYFRKFL